MRTFLRVAAIAYGIYLALALLVITPALNILPQKYLADNYSRELTTDWVLLNPFKLSLDISEAELRDDTGEPFVSFSEASVNLSLESIWKPGWVLDVVKVRDLSVDITRLSDDEFNFSDLIPEPVADEPPVPDEPATIPGVTIHDLELHSRTLVYEDRTRTPVFTSRWNGLNLQVAELSTVFEEGRPFSLAVEAEGGGKLHWDGEISIVDSTSTGRLELTNLNLHNLWLFAKPWLQLELKTGRLAVAGDYQLNWKDDIRYEVNEGSIGLSDVDIEPLDPAELVDTSIKLNALNVNDIALISSEQQVTIGNIAVEKLAVATWLQDAEVSLQKLFVINLPQDNSPPAPPAPTDEPVWQVALKKAQISDSSLVWRSEFTDPPVLNVQPINASVDNLNWPLAGDTNLSLDLKANEEAAVTVAGTLALEPGAGTLRYTLDGLPLSWFNPNLPAALKAAITGGHVAIKGDVALREFAPVTINLDGKILEFSARQEGAETMLTGWDSIGLNGLAVDMDEHSLALSKLTIDSYTGRLHINKDGSINASNIWKEEVGDEAQEIAEDLTEDKPWRFSIPKILVSDSAIDFMDESLPITFRTVIGELEGSVDGIDSQAGAAATVDMNGSVDGYAPVALNGTVAPFADTPDLDLNLTFDGVDMALLSPYSATYAGYVIDRGLLDLNLQYALKEDRLKGENSVRIEKLKLGEKIESDKAVDLPLELAIAIMTDSNGVIDISVPVSGDVDNPGFELGGVISKAFMNILTKAITAPFSLLANLVGTEDDLQRLTFTSGSSVVKESSRNKLNELASALQQRPQLSLVITGRLNLKADRERLQRNTLRMQLEEEGLSAEAIKARDPDWEAAIARRYAALPAADPAAGDPAAGDPAAAELSPREQYKQVEQSIAVSDDMMIKLANERAVAVKRYLVSETGLAPERAVVGQTSLKPDLNDFSGVELGIGT